MVGPMIHEYSGPAWLRPLLKTSYFVPCRIHTNSGKNECNFYCLDCIGDALCSSCVAEHSDHHIVQIRRSSYHNVIRVSDVSKFIDISCVQTYVINSAKILFLNERPQPRPGKGVINTCEICCRSLPDSFRFCSLGCKLNGMKRDPELTFFLRDRSRGSSEAGDSPIPRKLRKTLPFDRVTDFGFTTSDGEDKYPFSGVDNRGNLGSSIWPAKPSAVNYRTSRRKGIPRRSPF